jgi:hypothetical protein
MTVFNVQFNVEADDLAAAQALVGSWIVTAGTTLVSLSGTPVVMDTPVLVPEDGPISTGTVMGARGRGSPASATAWCVGEQGRPR